MNPRKIISPSFWFYVVAILALGLTLVSSGKRPPEFAWFLGTFIVSFVFGVIGSIRNSRRPISRFIVFDRDTGLVLFPSHGRWKNLVVLFEQVECNVGNWVGKGGMHFIFSIVALAKPRAKWGKRREHFMLGWVNDEREALMQWAFVNRFMDKTQPIPKEARENWKMIRWFQKNNLTIEKLMQARGVVDVDQRAGDFVIPPELRRQRANAA